MKKIIISIIFLLFLSSCSDLVSNQDTSNQNKLSSNGNYISIGTYEFNNLINNITESDVILDVRTLDEYNKGYIKGAILLDYYQPNFKEHLNLLNKDKTYYIYCRTGNRSGKTLDIMKELGFNSVIDLDKGIIDWNQQNLPMENKFISNMELKVNTIKTVESTNIKINIDQIDDLEIEDINGFDSVNLATMYGFEFKSEGFTFYFNSPYIKYGENHIGFGPLYLIPESPSDRKIKGHTYEMQLIEKDESLYGELKKIMSSDVYYTSHGGMCDLRNYVLKGDNKDIKISSSGCNTTKEMDDTYIKNLFGSLIKINK